MGGGGGGGGGGGEVGTLSDTGFIILINGEVFSHPVPLNFVFNFST